MKWLALALRIIVGGGMVLFGMMYFLGMMPKPPADTPETVVKLGDLLDTTGWLRVVKFFEVLGGVLVLSGRLTPLGLVILIPVTLNIAIWDALVVKYSMPPLGTILLALELVLLFCYRSYFKPFFLPKAQIG